MLKNLLLSEIKVIPGSLLFGRSPKLAGAHRLRDFHAVSALNGLLKAVYCLKFLGAEATVYGTHTRGACCLGSLDGWLAEAPPQGKLAHKKEVS